MKVQSFFVLFLLISTSVVYLSVPMVQADSTELWAVVVGVNGGDATHLDDDAMDFATALTSVYGYPSSNVKLLTNEEATKSAVLSALEWLDGQESSSDGVSIFFAAHGSEDQLHLYDAYLSDSELSNAVSGLESESVFVGVVACHSGSFLDVADSFSHGVLVTACAANESTYDLGYYGNTIFGEYFVDQGMLNKSMPADANGDNMTTVEEAFYYAYDVCANDPPGALSPTHPQMADKYPSESDNDFDLYLQAPFANPWFTSLPLILLATVAVLTYLRKKRNKTPK
ncbi:MAG: C13 family peptidase [Thermoproteota archaeon]